METTISLQDNSAEAALGQLEKALGVIAALSPDLTQMVVSKLMYLNKWLRRYRDPVSLELVVSMMGNMTFGTLLQLSDDEAYAIYQKANQFYSDGHYARALAVCEALVFLIGQHGSVFNLMAWCHAAEGRYDDALQHIEKALAEDPGDFDREMDKAGLLLHAGHFEAAMQVLRAHRPFKSWLVPERPEGRSKYGVDPTVLH